MTISSHLTPEPERRLWIILGNMRQCVESTDSKIAAITAFAAAELAFIKVMIPAGPLVSVSLLSLSAALPLGVLAFSPLTRIPKWLPFLQPPREKPSVGDCLISAGDMAKYSHLELNHRLDSYLGGGITATQYYEDIVGQILVFAHTAQVKQRLFRVSCVAVGFGQLGLLGF